MFKIRGLFTLKGNATFQQLSLFIITHAHAPVKTEQVPVHFTPVDKKMVNGHVIHTCLLNRFNHVVVKCTAAL